MIGTIDSLDKDKKNGLILGSDGILYRITDKTKVIGVLQEGALAEFEPPKSTKYPTITNCKVVVKDTVAV